MVAFWAVVATIITITVPLTVFYLVGVGVAKFVRYLEKMEDAE